MQKICKQCNEKENVKVHINNVTVAETKLKWGANS